MTNKMAKHSGNTRQRLPATHLGAKASLLLLGTCLLGHSLAMNIPPMVEQALADSPIPRAQVSLWAAPVDSGIDALPIVDWQSDVFRLPASVTKVFTTGIGLLLLGEDYRWKTQFFTNGHLSNGVLKGDLLIKGYGNPYFVEEEMFEMVVALRDRGINRIEGNLILDNSYFIRRVETPDAFDGHGMEPYNAIPNALSINFRTAKVIFNANSQGIHVTTEPQLQYLRIDNQMQLNRNKRCRGSGFAPRLSLDTVNQILTAQGTMSSACPEKSLTRVLGDAGDLFFGHFKRAWQLTGGTLDSDWLYGRIEENADLLYEWSSQPLSEQIEAMNKYSNNLMTRQLFLTIGAELTQPPATLPKARAVVMNRLHKLGIDTTGLFIDNGSGLSRQTRLTAAQLGQFLLAMQTTYARPFFEQSLSIVGVDGTLKRRLKNTPLAGNAIGKTGTLSEAKSLAGYLTAQSGRKFAYVMLFVGKKAKTGRPLMDELMQWIYYNH